MISKASITNYDRLLFMQALAKVVRAEDGLLLDAWELRFLQSFLQSSRPSLWFIGERIKWTDNLRRKYGHEKEINMPHPDDLADKRPAIPQADADSCEYLVSGDGRQQRCNDPATCQEPGKMRYCAKHGEGVERDMKRMGKTVRLIKYP